MTRALSTRALLVAVVLLAVAALAACSTAADNVAPAGSAQPTETPAPQLPEDGVHTPEDFRQQYEEWPDEHKMALDDDVVVRFAYPTELADWAGFAFIDHLPSGSSLTLGHPIRLVSDDGSTTDLPTEEIAGMRLRVHRHYQSEQGEARLEEALADEALVRGIAQIGMRSLPQGWPEDGPPEAAAVAVQDPEQCPTEPIGQDDLKPHIPEPNTYCGYVTSDDGIVPDGVPVSAVVEGNVCGTGRVNDGSYQVTVASPYCARAGDTVYFRVGGQWANEAGHVTHPMMGWFLVLTVGQMPEADAQPDADLPPHMLRVEPLDGATVGLDFRPCAAFDNTEDGLGLEPQEEIPVWMEIGGVEFEERIRAPRNTRRSNSDELDECVGSFRSLLEDGELDGLRPLEEGPLQLAVRYRTKEGEEYRHEWQVYLRLAAPEAPEEVRRVRETHRLFQQVRERAPQDVRDHFLDLEGDVFNVYLTPSGNPETVEAIVEDVFGPEGLPANGVRVVPGAEKASGWYRKAQDIIRSAADAQTSSYDAEEDLGRFSVQTPWDAHKGRVTLSKTDVPQEAVVFELSPVDRLEDLEGEPVAPNGVRISIDAPEEAVQGESIPVDVVLSNTRWLWVEFEYNPHFPKVVTAFTPEGQEVWSSFGGGFMTLPARKALLLPWQDLRFPTLWALVDSDGFALPPGEYILKATSTFDRDVVSEPHTLEVTR